MKTYCLMLVMICCVENSEALDVYQKVAVHGALEAYDEPVPLSPVYMVVGLHQLVVVY